MHSSRPSSFKSHSSERTEASPNRTPSRTPTHSVKMIISIGSNPDSKDSQSRLRRQDSINAGSFVEASDMKILRLGPLCSLSQRVLYCREKSQRLLSPLNDIPLHGPDGTLTCICKTPAGTWLKFEAALDEPFHPVRHLTKPSCFVDSTIIGIESTGWKRIRNILARSARPDHYPDNAPWNVCMLPQTEVSIYESKGLPMVSSDRAMEVIEIGAHKLRKTGDVYSVKPLGAFSLEGSYGGQVWVVLAIACDDAMAPMMSDIASVISYLPGLLDLVSEWIKDSMASAQGTDVGYLRVNGPYLLATAQSKVTESHRAWLRSKEKNIAEVPASLQESRQLAVPDLEDIWAQYTGREVLSLFHEGFTVSCPTSESNILFQEAWIDPTADDSPQVTFSTPPNTVPGSRSSSDGLSSAVDTVTGSPVSVLREKAKEGTNRSSFVISRTKEKPPAVSPLKSKGSSPLHSLHGNESPLSDLSLDGKSQKSQELQVGRAQLAGRHRQQASEIDDRTLHGGTGGSKTVFIRGRDSGEEGKDKEKERHRGLTRFFHIHKTDPKKGKEKEVEEEKFVPLGLRAIKHMSQQSAKNH